MRCGRELARWMAALQRAHASRAEEEGRHHIKRVHVLTAQSADGLLRRVGKKRREYRELHQTPERTSFYAGIAARAVSTPPLGRRGSTASAATGWLSLPTAHGGWLWRWDDGEAKWIRLWCMLQGRALLCYAETFAGVDVADAASDAAAAALP